MAYLTAQREHTEGRLFPNVRCFPGGGAPKPPQLAHDLEAEMGAPVVSGWGLTEAPILTMASPEDPADKLANTEGAPMPGVELKLVTLDGTVAGPGEEGEIRAKAPQLMKGYLDASLDAEAFDEDGYFRTGDLGRLDDEGNLHVVGRAKDMIISGGEKIYPLEVERLLRQHPAVRDCALVGVPDREWGESVLAVVVAETGHAITADEVSRYVRTRLAGYKTPRYVEFVDALPVTSATGKVQKELLRARYREQYSR
jgi:acyl-CoA synthetase (AMP-forming)/AMP-acid ligase II